MIDHLFYKLGSAEVTTVHGCSVALVCLHVMYTVRRAC